MANGEIQNFAIPEGTPVSAPTASPVTVLVANVIGFAAAVSAQALITVLTGYVVGTPVAIAATDTILAAFGKVQALINDLQAQIDVWIEAEVTIALNNNSNVTLTNITQLAFPVVAGREYKIEITLMHRSAAAATGLAVTMAATGAVGTLALTAQMMIAADGTAAGYQGAITAFGDLVISTAVPAATTDYICRMDGVFVCTTGGTLTPQFRSEVNASQVTIGVGSCILVREFA
jgi:hypothetical protein